VKLIFWEAQHTFGPFSGSSIPVPIWRSNQLASINHATVNMSDCQFINMTAITPFRSDSWVWGPDKGRNAGFWRLTALATKIPVLPDVTSCSFAYLHHVLQRLTYILLLFLFFFFFFFFFFYFFYFFFFLFFFFSLSFSISSSSSSSSSSIDSTTLSGSWSVQQFYSTPACPLPSPSNQ